MVTRVGKRFALVVATAALAVGVTQAQASASAQWLVEGWSTDAGECSYVAGQYSYANDGVLGGLQSYYATWDLDVTETCPSGTAHLQMEYDSWNALGGTWSHNKWLTVASSAGWSNVTDHRSMVRNIHFRACTYSGGANKNCGTVS